jgi:hypothetical protein
MKKADSRFRFCELMATIHGDALRGHLENLVLSALEKGDAHGFEILKRLEEAGRALKFIVNSSAFDWLFFDAALSSWFRGCSEWEQFSASGCHHEAMGKSDREFTRGRFG